VSFVLRDRDLSIVDDASSMSCPLELAYPESSEVADHSTQKRAAAL
jgi:hypothetical protein